MMGLGFRPGASSLGLISMRERAAEVGRSLRNHLLPNWHSHRGHAAVARDQHDPARPSFADDHPLFRKGCGRYSIYCPDLCRG